MHRLGAGHVGADSPQQVRAGPDRLAPQGVREEPTVGQNQHARLQSVQQGLGQGGLGLGVGADLCGEDGMGAALGQRNDPGLREGRLLSLVDPRPAKELRVPGRVGDIETGPIDRDQPASGQPHTGSPLSTDRPGHPLEQHGQQLRAQPSPGLKDRRLARRRVRLLPSRGPREPVGQLGQHVFIGPLGVQRHPDREVRHHPCR